MKFSINKNDLTNLSLIKLGIHAKPHLATAYPGSEWYYKYKDSIVEQYSGDLEKYILDLGDATKITATISHKFTAMEILGLQEIVAQRDLRLLELSEKHWRDFEGCVAKPGEMKNFISKKIPAPLQLNADL